MPHLILVHFCGWTGLFSPRIKFYEPRRSLEQLHVGMRLFDLKSREVDDGF
jgi:hypothetical protein